MLSDDNNATWFNVFDIIFELVSAYGTVGLSLGVPYDNYSCVAIVPKVSWITLCSLRRFSGAFSVLGKLVVTAVMLRGRHRGLPVAVRFFLLLRAFADARVD